MYWVSSTTIYQVKHTIQVSLTTVLSSILCCTVVAIAMWSKHGLANAGLHMHSLFCCGFGSGYQLLHVQDYVREEGLRMHKPLLAYTKNTALLGNAIKNTFKLVIMVNISEMFNLITGQ